MPIADRYPDAKDHPFMSPDRAAAITPDDNNDLTEVTRGINVAVTGVVRVTPSEQTDPVDLYIAAGIPFQLRAKRIHETGTTALGIVGLF